jgi:DIS3-like exonuclease 2
MELEMSSTGSSEDLKENGERNKEPKYFPNHISPKEVQQGLKSGQLVRGVFSVNPKFTKMCFVESECSQSSYVISSLIDRNRAMDKDEVILKKKTKNDQKTEVEVVHIAKKVHPRSAVGYLKPLEGNKNFALFSPRDKKVPKMHIHKSHWPADFETDPARFKDILFFVKMSKWSKVRQALGEIVEVLGVSGNFQVERVVVLREFCINPKFDKAVLAKCVQWSQMECYREDLRRRCVFTIDKSGTADIDDALSCEELSNGNYEISVHISDVSYYLREHTQMDEAVRDRATSVYLMDQVCHMLPDELRSECSLFPGCNKRTFSIFWEITPNGQIVKRRGVKTVINSCARLTYTQAHKLIDDALDEPVQVLNGFTLADLSKSLKNLHKMASILRNHRKLYYGVSTGHVKASFLFDASGEPLDIVNEDKVPTQELVEEFMLLANATVAQRIYREFPDLALLRTHAGPIPAKMSKLRNKLAGVGIHIDASSAKEIQKSLDKYVGDDDLGRIREIVLKWLVHNCMKKQKYVCSGSCKEHSNLGHFGLGFPVYTYSFHVAY